MPTYIHPSQLPRLTLTSHRTPAIHMLEIDAVPTLRPAVRHADVHVLMVSSLARRLLLCQGASRLLERLFDEPLLVLLLCGAGLVLEFLGEEPAGVGFSEEAGGRWLR